MLELRSLTKKFGQAVAVDDVSFTCEDREFVVVFGPAGAGKTTTLRLVAGVLEPTSGSVFLNGQDMAHVPPERRNMSMAFENYNLYSHLTVYENLAFPLTARNVDRGETRKRVQAMAEVMQITSLLDRRPGFLSGGQRQRVALGRALIRGADVYLLDEPISHLDAKLRHLMRGELKAMCAEKNATVIHVTHDYKEAMALSDRIVVLNKGRLMQIGTPDEVYHRPANEFVAGFLGDPPMSFLNAELVRDQRTAYLRAGRLQVAVGDNLAATIGARSPSGQIRMGIRATDLNISPAKSDICNVPVEVYVVETFGYRNIVTCQCDGSDRLQSVAPPDQQINVQDTAWLELTETQIHVFAPDGAAISHPSAVKG